MLYLRTQLILRFRRFHSCSFSQPSTTRLLPRIHNQHQPSEYLPHCTIKTWGNNAQPPRLEAHVMNNPPVCKDRPNQPPLHRLSPRLTLCLHRALYLRRTNTIEPICARLSKLKQHVDMLGSKYPPCPQRRFCEPT